MPKARRRAEEGQEADYRQALDLLQALAETPCRDTAELWSWCEEARDWLSTYVRRFAKDDWTAWSTPAQRLAAEAAKRVYSLQLDSEFLEALGTQLPPDSSVMPAAAGYRILQKLAEVCQARLTAEAQTRKQGEGAAKSAPKRRRKRGRPADTDPKADKKIEDAWQTGQYRTHEDLAGALNTSRREVTAALDRQRKRRKRKRG